MKHKSLRSLPVLALSGVVVALALVSDAGAKKPNSTTKSRRFVPNTAGVMAAIKKTQRPISQASKTQLARLQQAHKHDAKMAKPNMHASILHSKWEIAKMWGLSPDSIGNTSYRIDALRPRRLLSNGGHFYWTFALPTRVGPYGAGNTLESRTFRSPYVILHLTKLDSSKGYLVECDVTHESKVQLVGSRSETSVKVRGGGRERQTISQFIYNQSKASLFLFPYDYRNYNEEEYENHTTVHACEVREVSL